MSYAYSPSTSMMRLGAVGDVDPSKVQRVREALDELVSTTQAQTQRIVDGVGDGIVNLLFSVFTLNQITPEKAAIDWQNSIVQRAKSLRSILTKTTASGNPFFADFPDSAQASTKRTQQDILEETQAFLDASKMVSFSAALSGAVEKVTQAILDLTTSLATGVTEGLLKGGVASPLGAVLVLSGLAVAGLVFYTLKIRK